MIDVKFSYDFRWWTAMLLYPKLYRNILVYVITEKIAFFNLKPFLIKDMRPSSNKVKKRKTGNYKWVVYSLDLARRTWTISSQCRWFITGTWSPGMCCCSLTSFQSQIWSHWPSLRRRKNRFGQYQDNWLASIALAIKIYSMQSEIRNCLRRNNEILVFTEIDSVSLQCVSTRFQPCYHLARAILNICVVLYQNLFVSSYQPRTWHNFW